MLKTNNPYINRHLEMENKLNTKFELPICLMPMTKGPIPRGYAKFGLDMRYAEEYFDWIERRTK